MLKILSLPAESHIMKVHCSWCITTLVLNAQSRKLKKFINMHWSTKPLRRGFITPLELFCRDFVDISYENASFRIIEDIVWLQHIYFVTTIVFLSVKYIFPLYLLREVFIAKISYYGKFTVLRKLISIVLQLTNQIK